MDLGGILGDLGGGLGGNIGIPLTGMVENSQQPIWLKRDLFNTGVPLKFL